MRLSRGPIVASAAVASEARQRLATIEMAMIARPHPLDLAEWLYRLAQSVEKAPLEEGLDLAVGRLVVDLQDFPACLFTDANRRQVACDLVWWPSYAKLANALGKLQASLLTEQKCLEAVVAAGASIPCAAPAPPASVRKTPTAEAIREVQAKVQELKDMAPPRKAKRWLPLPAAPARSVSEQMATLNEWPWQPKTAAADAP